MDEQMIGRLLQSYGAPTSVRNANAARQFFATNPEIAEKRAMGMRGSGIDDNSDVFGAQLDKFIADSAPQQQITQSELPPIETVQQATTPNAPRKKMEPSRQGEYGPGPSPSRQGEYGGGSVTRESARGGKGFGLDDILTALLGISSVAGISRMGPNPNAPGALDDPRVPPAARQALTDQNADLPRLTYQPKLEAPQGTENAARNDPRVPAQAKPSVVTSDAALTEQARRQQLQAEIDSENADAKRLQDQIAERNKKQNATRDLLKNAKRTVTGR